VVLDPTVFFLCFYLPALLSCRRVVVFLRLVLVLTGLASIKVREARFFFDFVLMYGLMILLNWYGLCYV